MKAISGARARAPVARAAHAGTPGARVVALLERRLPEASSLALASRSERFGAPDAFRPACRVRPMGRDHSAFVRTGQQAT